MLADNSPIGVVRSAQHVARAEHDYLFRLPADLGLLALELDGRQVN
jgi:hypothetical protein